MATSLAPRLLQRTFQTSFFTWFDPDTKTVAAEVYIRAIDGLFYHALEHGRVLNRTPKQLYHDTYRRGFYSHRPYSVSQAADPSCVYVVLALMLNLVYTQEIKPATFVDEAKEFPSRRLLPCPEWTLQATWEGVVYPPVWSKREINALKRSLMELRLHSFLSALDRELPA
jgi:hypothetical protein